MARAALQASSYGRRVVNHRSNVDIPKATPTRAAATATAVSSGWRIETPDYLRGHLM